MKILIVDDHPIVRAGLRQLLAGDGGHEMREAASRQASMNSLS
jgi:DNA-binding NarL/FixJ family response regulator